MGTDVQKLTEIDLSELQIGEKLTIYRGSAAFLTGPGAAGYAGEAVVTGVKKKSAILYFQPLSGAQRIYRLRFKDMRICRVPNGEPTMLYVHARHGRPTITAYFTADEYTLVKELLADEIHSTAITFSRKQRLAKQALERMGFHDALRR